MVVEAIDLGDNLDDLVNYTKGRFLPVSEATGHLKILRRVAQLNFFTVFYVKGRRFKAVPEVDLRFLKPPHAPLQVPSYDSLKGGRIQEFVFVSPKDSLDENEQYAVREQDYDPQRLYSRADLRYCGSPLGVALDKGDARRHNVLVASFGGSRKPLDDFLDDMEAHSDGKLRVKLMIERSDKPLFTTCSLRRYVSRKDKGTSLVIRAKDLGRSYLFDGGQ